jgi:hypothetical protein
VVVQKAPTLAHLDPVNINVYIAMQNELGMENEGYWIEVMKENEIYYKEQELKEKRKLRKDKLNKLNERR